MRDAVYFLFLILCLFVVALSIGIVPMLIALAVTLLIDRLLRE